MRSHCCCTLRLCKGALYTPPPIPTGLPDSYWILLGLQQISYWLITIQIWYPSPTGVLVNSYWNHWKLQISKEWVYWSPIQGVQSSRNPVGIFEYNESNRTSSLSLLLLFLYNIKKSTPGGIEHSTSRLHLQ